MYRIIILSVVAVSLITFAYSVSGNEQYGIVLSKSCYIMVKNNLPTNCPSYEQINALFPDNTDKRTGELQYIDGMFQRGPPKMLNPIQVHMFDNIPTIWIDPPGNVRDKIVLLTIEPSVPDYKIQLESTKMDDYNITFGKNRWINTNCTEARITAENWVYLTGDTMNLLKHNCDPKFTSFDSTVTYSFAKSYQDLASSSKYKLDEFIKLAKEKYKVSHIGSNDKTINKSVIEDEDVN